ncbi:MAG: transcription elongation factor GreA [Caldilineae bacterium]|nr:MAG: transcription elongation factor GreA [Caldilineae bacterium]
MSSQKPVYLTKEGLEKLQEELDYLRNVRRAEIAQQIAEAKAEGDLRENAGYDEAKNAQAFVEGRIRELEAKIRNAHIIEESQQPSDEVALGRKVVVQEDGFPDKESYIIVGSTEADPAKGKISNESPIGKALLGKKKGDKVTVTTPGGAIDFTILHIE